jgi:hypothetical protein
VTARRPNRVPSRDRLEALECQVCNGSGKTYLEHPDGSLSEEVCAYCHGSKDSMWWEEREMRHQGRIDARKTLVWFYVCLVGMTFSQSLWRHDAALKWVHAAVCLVAVVGLLWVFAHPKPSRKAPRQPNPLTTDREKLMGAGVVGAAWLKTEVDRRFPRR